MSVSGTVNAKVLFLALLVLCLGCSSFLECPSLPQSTAYSSSSPNFSLRLLHQEEETNTPSLKDHSLKLTVLIHPTEDECLQLSPPHPLLTCFPPTEVPSSLSLPLLPQLSSELLQSMISTVFPQPPRAQ